MQKQESKKISVVSKDVPPAIGPYSQAVIANNFLYASGMLPVNPLSLKIESADIKLQTEQIFKNITSLLSTVNLGLNDIIKTTVFLKDMSTFTQMNEVYAKCFEGCDVLPARSAVEVSRLPKDVLIEIEIIALLK